MMATLTLTTLEIASILTLLDQKCLLLTLVAQKATHKTRVMKMITTLMILTIAKKKVIMATLMSLGTAMMIMTMNTQYLTIS